MATFQLSDKELNSFEDFKEEHKDCNSKHLGISSLNKHSFVITPTGIGLGVQAVCNICGEHKDITDYESW